MSIGITLFSLLKQCQVIQAEGLGHWNNVADQIAIIIKG